jgi:hypothetical protein
MSDFWVGYVLVGYVLGVWTCGTICAVSLWMGRSLRHEEPKPWE